MQFFTRPSTMIFFDAVLMCHRCSLFGGFTCLQFALFLFPSMVLVRSLPFLPFSPLPPWFTLLSRLRTMSLNLSGKGFTGDCWKRPRFGNFFVLESKDLNFLFHFSWMGFLFFFPSSSSLELLGRFRLLCNRLTWPFVGFEPALRPLTTPLKNNRCLPSVI